MLLTLGVLIVLVYLKLPGKKQAPRRQQSTGVQELLRYKDISPGGIVELAGHKYRLTLEVQPVNMALKSKEEQASLWLAFRTLLHSLTLPVALIVQSRHLDLNNYVRELRLLAGQASTRELADYGGSLAQYLDSKVDSQNIRDRRYYVVIKIDTSDLADIDSGIVIENELINSVLRGIRRQSLSDADARDLAYQELENTASMLTSALENMGLKVRVLDQPAVLELIYATINRDLAPVARIADADRAGVFHLSPLSLTPFLAGGSEDDQKENQAIFAHN